MSPMAGNGSISPVLLGRGDRNPCKSAHCWYQRQTANATFEGISDESDYIATKNSRFSNGKTILQSFSSTTVSKNATVGRRYTRVRRRCDERSPRGARPPLIVAHCSISRSPSEFSECGDRATADGFIDTDRLAYLVVDEVAETTGPSIPHLEFGLDRRSD